MLTKSECSTRRRDRIHSGARLSSEKPCWARHRGKLSESGHASGPARFETFPIPGQGTRHLQVQQRRPSLVSPRSSMFSSSCCIYAPLLIGSDLAVQTASLLKAGKSPRSLDKSNNSDRFPSKSQDFFWPTPATFQNLSNHSFARLFILGGSKFPLIR